MEIIELLALYLGGGSKIYEELPSDIFPTDNKRWFLSGIYSRISTSTLESIRNSQDLLRRYFSKINLMNIVNLDDAGVCNQGWIDAENMIQDGYFFKRPSFKIHYSCDREGSDIGFYVEFSDLDKYIRKPEMLKAKLEKNEIKEKVTVSLLLHKDMELGPNARELQKKLLPVLNPIEHTRKLYFLAKLFVSKEKFILKYSWNGLFNIGKNYSISWERNEQ